MLSEAIPGKWHSDAEANREPFIRALQDLLDSGPPPRVHFAESVGVPPPLAFITTFPRLAAPLSGVYTVSLSHQGKTHSVAAGRGDVVFSDRNCWDRPEWTEDCVVMTFLFGRKQIGVSLVQNDSASEKRPTVYKTHVTGHLRPLAYELLESLRLTAQMDRVGRARVGGLLTGALLNACLLQMLEPGPDQRKANHTFEAICLYMQENFHQELSRESVAEHFSISPSHVSRLFRLQGHMQFSDYLNHVRVDRAKFLLITYKGMTVKEVAGHCGYSEANYFCRAFKKIARMPPASYRLNHP